MSDDRESGERSAEERAEEVVQRVVQDGSRLMRKAFGRVREEVEDIVAEAREKHEGAGGSRGG